MKNDAQSEKITHKDFVTLRPPADVEETATGVEIAFEMPGVKTADIDIEAGNGSFKISITCTLVSVSSAPVGSSARMISGSFTSARAIATRCI